MSFATTLMLLIALPFEYIQGEDYCSGSEKGKVECIPCSDLCPWAQQPSNVSCHFCPNQCGNSIPASKCLDICNRNCLNGRCEYRNRLMDLTCIGCEPEFTGKVCQEVCPLHCRECNQFDGTCLSCKENYTGPNCTESNQTTDLTSPSIVATIEDCTTCDVTIDDLSTLEFDTHAHSSSTVAQHASETFERDSKHNTCLAECAWQCRNNRCNSDKEGNMRCSEGCRDGFTGSYCQETCPQICNTCQQFSLLCTSCDVGFQGEYCSEESETSTSSSTTTASEERNQTLDPCQNALCGDTTIINTPPPLENTETKHKASQRDLVIVIVGVAAATIIIIVTVIVSYKIIIIKRRKQRKSDKRGKAGTNADRATKAETYYTYDYIDDVSLCSYYSSLQGQGARKTKSQDTYPNHKRGTHAVPSSEIETYMAKSHYVP